MSFVAAAYVTVKTIDSMYPNLYEEGNGVNTGIYDLYGYYFKYAGGSLAGNRLGYYQIAMLTLYEAWALGVTVTSVWSSMQVWDLVDARLAEAAKDSIGVETPITMNLAIKTFTLLIVAGLTVLISGYSLG